jgi:hypothetical protein
VPSNTPANDYEQTNSALPRLQAEPIRYIGTVKDNDYVYHPEDHVFNRHRIVTPVLTRDFAVAGAQQKRAPSAKGPINVGTPANKTNGYGSVQYEHPSAVPRPLRRVSGTDSSRSSSGGRSLRERFFEADGLGIELSDAPNLYDNDNGTTLAVDGDGSFERRRETASMRSPEVYDKHTGFSSYTSELPKTSKEHKYRSHPVQSSKDMMAGVTSHLEANLQHKMDLMGGKIERLVAIHSRNEGHHMSTQKSIDQILAEQRKLRDDMGMIINNQNVLYDAVQAVVVESRFHYESVAAEHREIRASISDLAEHSVDNAKAALLVDSTVERLHPSIIRAMEKEDFNAERILARVDSLDIGKMGKERKPKKVYQHAAGAQPLLTTPANNTNFSPMAGVHYSPSAVGPFSPNGNPHLASNGGSSRNTGGLKYTEDPSSR